MPSVASQRENNFLQVLRLGLLTYSVDTPAGLVNCPAYGLRGKDMLNIQRTCKTADTFVKLTPNTESKIIALACRNLFDNIPPAPQSVQRAVNYLAAEMQGTNTKAFKIYNAIRELEDFKTRGVLSFATEEERRIGFVFVFTLHAKSGVMTNPGLVEAWRTVMRMKTDAGFFNYLKDLAGQMVDDAQDLAFQAGVAAGTGYGLFTAVSNALNGEGARRLIAAASIFVWPRAAQITVDAARNAGHIAIGLGEMAHGVGREGFCALQSGYFKDALLYKTTFDNKTLEVISKMPQNLLDSLT